MQFRDGNSMVTQTFLYKQYKNDSFCLIVSVEKYLSLRHIFFFLHTPCMQKTHSFTKYKFMEFMNPMYKDVNLIFYNLYLRLCLRS